jgi:hypothetical protein
MTFLQAVAHLNNNPRLLLLEEHLGTAKRSYQSFYFPKEKQLEGKSAATLMASLMLESGVPAEVGARLLNQGRAQVSKDRIIRLFPKDDDSHALEFEQNAAFIWKKRKDSELVDLFGNLKKRYAALGISIESHTDGKDLTQRLEKEGRDHGLSL